MSIVVSPPVEIGSQLAIRGERDVALLEQSKPILAEAEGSTYELLAQVRLSLHSRRRFPSF